MNFQNERPGVCRAFDFRSALLTTLLTGLVLPALLLTTLAGFILATLLTALILLTALLLLVLIILVWVAHRFFSLLFISSEGSTGGRGLRSGVSFDTPCSY